MKENYVRKAELKDALEAGTALKKGLNEGGRVGLAEGTTLWGKTKDMSKDYKHVYNFVDERNWKSLKWLQFLGFEPKRKIGDFGIGKMPFILMMKEVNN